ncbi:MAG: HD-GYP domain-containing protein [Bacillota bacterium]|nr:HD-GYP domain-containing protein [Bacillota bacterium]
MQYLRKENLSPDMLLAKAIVGEDGRLLIGAGTRITSTLLKRIVSMGFQGAYVDTPGFEDIVVNDVIPDELRTKAFEALYKSDYPACVSIAKKMVQEMKYKETLKLDLLDIKNDKNYEYRHCVSVAVYCIAIGIGYGMNEEQLENLAVAGLLHDIGKFDVKKRVLNAKHVYNDREMDEMKKHPMYSYEILKDYPFISSVARNSILFHHENLDGSGYYGITEEKLGIFPRIIRVADTYDAFTAQRKYREAYSPAYAMEYLMSNVGTLFDKNIVEIFARQFPIYPNGFTLRLSNGEVAVVVSNDMNSQRPLVRRMDKVNVDLGTDPEYRTVMIEDMM